jgi:hypothetical protein
MDRPWRSSSSYSSSSVTLSKPSSSSSSFSSRSAFPSASAKSRRAYFKTKNISKLKSKKHGTKRNSKKRKSNKPKSKSADQSARLEGGPCLERVRLDRKQIGSRKQVFDGYANETAEGLDCNHLVRHNGRIVPGRFFNGKPLLLPPFRRKPRSILMSGPMNVLMSGAKVRRHSSRAKARRHSSKAKTQRHSSRAKTRPHSSKANSRRHSKTRPHSSKVKTRRHKARRHSKARQHSMEDLRGAILACNDGNVFLTEAPDADGVPRIRVIAARDPLPRTHPADCAFHSNQAFVAATRAKEAFAVFPTPSGNTLVVPTKSFTSIRDFARRSTKQEFADLFRAVFKVRAAANTRTGRQHWIETIGYDVPHLHLRVVTNRMHRA